LLSGGKEAPICSKRIIVKFQVEYEMGTEKLDFVEQICNIPETKQDNNMCLYKVACWLSYGTKINDLEWLFEVT